jgi:hypothetical protein
MNRELKPGGRVRVTSATAMQCYQPGDTGIVLQALLLSPLGRKCYVVQMDKDPSNLQIVFMGKEIEAAD